MPSGFETVIKKLKLDNIKNGILAAEKMRPIAYLAKDFPLFLDLLVEILVGIKDSDVVKEVIQPLCGPNGLDAQTIQALNNKLAIYDVGKKDIVRNDISSVSALRKLLTVLGITTDEESNRFNFNNLSKFFDFALFIYLSSEGNLKEPYHLSNETVEELTLLAKGYLSNTKLMVDYAFMIPPNIITQCSDAYKLLEKNSYVDNAAQQEKWQYGYFAIFIAMSMMQQYIVAYAQLHKNALGKLSANRKDNIKLLDKRFFNDDAELAESLRELLANPLFSMALKSVEQKNNVYGSDEIKDRLQNLSTSEKDFKKGFKQLLQDPKFRKSLEVLIKAEHIFMIPMPEKILSYMVFVLRYENLSSEHLAATVKEDASNKFTSLYDAILRILSYTFSQPTMSTGAWLASKLEVPLKSDAFHHRMEKLGIDLVYSDGQSFPDVFLKLLDYLSGTIPVPSMPEMPVQPQKAVNEDKQIEKEKKRLLKDRRKLEKDAEKVWNTVLTSEVCNNNDMIAKLFAMVFYERTSELKVFFEKSDKSTLINTLENQKFCNETLLEYMINRHYASGIIIVLRFYIENNLKIRESLGTSLTILATQLDDKKILNLLVQLNSSMNSDSSYQLVKSPSVHELTELRKSDSTVKALTSFFGGSNSKKNHSGSSTSSASSTPSRTPPLGTPTRTSPSLSRSESDASIAIPSDVESLQSTTVVTQTPLIIKRAVT